MSNKTSNKTSIDHEDQPQANNSFWDIIRYVSIIVLLAVGIWYYYSQKPLVLTAQETRGMTMGTDYSVKVADFVKETDHRVWENIEVKIQQRLDGIDRAMSTYRADSEVSRFNNSDSTDWFNVSKDTAEVIHTALEISRLTEGAFDITVSPLVDLWGFGANQQADLTFKDLEEKTIRIKPKIGYDKLEVRLQPPAIKKSIPELRIDLSAIAKGYAVDCVAILLEENGFANFMVEVGGEVRCRGYKGISSNYKATSHNWIIGIEKPFIVSPDGFSGLQRKLPINDLALATSGDYQSYREINGVRYSHFIDPRTGFPTEYLAAGEPKPVERLGSVSVITERCIHADAWATAFFVLGEHKGLELAEKHGIAVLFLFRTEQKDQPVREAASTTFPKGE
ncbi:MAG: FAD:protein FMN transferase [Planctomycetaceae bacterium]|jgi:thiamine biosynthesis lipoprotein|nr:FAD:protein FMN transferase [Planctomycetaceae bacterium]